MNECRKFKGHFERNAYVNIKLCVLPDGRPGKAGVEVREREGCHNVQFFYFNIQDGWRSLAFLNPPPPLLHSQGCGEFTILPVFSCTKKQNFPSISTISVVMPNFPGKEPHSFLTFSTHVHSLRHR